MHSAISSCRRLARVLPALVAVAALAALPVATTAATLQRSTTLPLVLVQSQRAFDWNGNWGRLHGPGVGIVINGQSVRYFWNGNEGQVTNLRMGPQEVSFDLVGASGRSVILTPARNGRMTFTTWARNEARSSFEIWRP